MLDPTFNYLIVYFNEMDPLGDLFSFINKDDLNGDKETLSKFNKRCNLCKEGEVHEKCTTGPNFKTDGEFACNKCEYTCDKKMRLRFHIEAVHIKVKRFKCSACSYASFQGHAVQRHAKEKHKDETPFLP